MPGLLGEIARLLVRAHVEADDDRLRGLGQRDVGFGDAADAAVNDPRPTSSLPSFSSAAVIASTEPWTSPLMTIGSSLRPAAFRLLIMSRERGPSDAAARRQLLAPLTLAIFGDFARARFALDHGDAVAGFRRAGEAEHLDRRRRRRADSTFSPLSSISARTRPHCEPATTSAPTLACPAARERSRPGRGRGRAALR